ncbi:unnamed protein product [Discula destructiva]
MDSSNPYGSNPYGYSNGYGPPPGQGQADQQPYPAYYQAPPPGYMPADSNAYYDIQPPAAQQYYQQQPPPTAQPYAPPTDPAQPSLKAPDTEKSLTDKFAGLLGAGGRRSSSSSASSSSSCSDCSTDEDKKKTKKKKKKSKSKSKSKKRPKFSTPPQSNPHDGPYPFSIFTPKDDPEHIVLALAPAGASTAQLTGPRHHDHDVAYKITWAADATSRHNIMRHDLPTLSPSRPTWAGLGRTDAEGKLWFQFPWGDWGDVDALEEFWASDVGWLNESRAEAGREDAAAAAADHWLQWAVVRDMDAETNGRFTARCHDTTAAGMPEVVRFEVDGGGMGRLVVPARTVRTVEQLDEVVTVACTIMKRLGDVVMGT